MLVAKYGMVDFYFSRAHHSPDTCKNQIANSLEFLAILSLCCSLFGTNKEKWELLNIQNASGWFQKQLNLKKQIQKLVTDLVIQRWREGHLYTYEEKCAFCWLLVRKVLRKYIGMSPGIVICAIYSVVEQSKRNVPSCLTVLFFHPFSRHHW